MLDILKGPKYPDISFPSYVVSHKIVLANSLSRLFLSAHELLVLRDANACRSLGFAGFPVWSLYVISVSNVLLVSNSLPNIPIYCGLSLNFREEFCHITAQTYVAARSGEDGQYIQVIRNDCKAPFLSQLNSINLGVVCFGLS